ncbi:MAG: DUF177 domain-containing protein [Pseudomonadota bacterium]
MKPVLSHPLRLTDLPRTKPVHVRLVPDEGQLEALSDRLDVDVLRKVRLEGDLAALGKTDWLFQGQLGATIVQPCRVTTHPVTTRVDETLLRTYSATYETPEGEEAEMPEDDSIEPLPGVLDMGDVLEEALALVIPDFPRAEGADEIDLSVAPPGAEPIDDDKIKPFAALASLKARMDKDD